MKRLFIILALLCAPVFAGPQTFPAVYPPQCNSAPGGVLYCKTIHEWATQFFSNYSRISDLTVDFCTAVPVHVEISGQLGLLHRNLAFEGYNDWLGRPISAPVGYAVRVGYRYAATLSGLGPRPTSANPGAYATTGVTFISGAKSAGNIRDITEHYGEASLSAYEYFSTPGCYRMEVWANSHSSVSTAQGLISLNRDFDQEPKDTYGYMLTKVTPVN